MSSQTQYFIELGDVLALRFKCKHCETIVSLPMSAKDKRMEMLGACPNCNEPWLLSCNVSIVPAVAELTAALLKLTAIIQERDKSPDTGVSLMLEVKHDETRATSR